VYHQSIVSPLRPVTVIVPSYEPLAVPEGIYIPHHILLPVGVPVIGLGTLVSASVGVVVRAVAEEYEVEEVRAYFW
jgi:hypothetical protein